MIVLHHLERSRSQRVLWLLEELELGYEIRHYRRDPVTMLALPELKAVHPLGKSPVITDGEVVLAESGAITTYLIERHGQGRLRPAIGSPERLRFTYWLHYAEGSLMPPLVMKLIFDRLPSSPMPFFVRPVARLISAGFLRHYLEPQIGMHLDYLEGELARSPWFAGDEFSAADIQMSFPIEAAASRMGLGTSRPRLGDWLARIHERPAYRRALEAGGEHEPLG